MDKIGYCTRKQSVNDQILLNMGGYICSCRDEEDQCWADLGYVERVILRRANWNQKLCLGKGKKRCSFVREYMQVIIIPIMVKYRVHKAIWKQMSENLLITFFFFFINSHFGDLSVCQCIHLANCIKFSFRHNKGMNKISILAVLVAFSLISCAGSYLSRPCDNENGSLHITKILLISHSLKAIKILMLFIFTF